MTLGLEEAGLVEVTSGVSSGESVVVAGQGGLKDGTKIKVLGSSSSPAGVTAEDRTTA